MDIVEKKLAEETLDELTTNMGQIASIMHEFGVKTNDIYMMSKASVIAVIGEILKDDDVLDFSEFLKFYTSKVVVDKIGPTAIAEITKEKTSEEFVEELKAFDVFKKDFENLGESGLERFKDNLRKKGGFDINQISD